MRGLLTLLIMVVSIGITLGQEDVPEHRKKKKFDIAAVPIVNYNTSYGAVVGANSMVFFNLSQKDTLSPSSVAGIGGGFSQNRSIFIAGFTLLYLKQNKWRINAAGGAGDIRFQFYPLGMEGSEEGFVDYNTVSSFGVIRILRRVIGHFYGGAMLKLQYSNTDFESIPPVTQSVVANGIGVNGLYDTRNNIYYPSRGVFASVSWLANTPWLKSDSVFRSVRAFFNTYNRIGYRTVLATRVSAFLGIGEVPFIGQHAIGGKDIRGYADGRYRGDQAYCAQAEWRWTVHPRWGIVGFAGLGLINKPYSGLLPGGGAGVRFRAIPQRSVNIGVDAAVGKGDYGVYFRIGEVF